VEWSEGIGLFNSSVICRVRPESPILVAAVKLSPSVLPTTVIGSLQLAQDLE